MLDAIEQGQWDMQQGFDDTKKCYESYARETIKNDEHLKKFKNRLKD
ncbi:MAG: hypothetical protein ACI9E5_001257 [Candidatus Omnitrophota bacterium]|jgi:hypothetical protein